MRSTAEQFRGPLRLRSGNAIDILGGSTGMPSATIGSTCSLAPHLEANNAAELVAAIRQQLKEGADFTALKEWRPLYGRRHALGKRVAVHATGEPGTLLCGAGWVVSIDMRCN